MTEKLKRSAILPSNPRLNVSRSANLPHVPGIRIGDYIFLSGMGPIDPQTGERRHGPIAEQVRTTALTLYQFAADYARARGIIIADTKFEFGTDRDGRLVLGDEALTPDSSRFWPAEQYAPGGPQPSFDKQYVRDFCEKTGWNKTYPGPELPADVVTGTRARYVEVFEKLTSIPFDQYLNSPQVVLAVTR